MTIITSSTFFCVVVPPMQLTSQLKESDPHLPNYQTICIGFCPSCTTKSSRWKSLQNMKLFHIYHLCASWWGPIDLQENIIVLFHVGIGLCTLNWNFTYQFILGTWFLNFNLVDFFVLVVLLWLWMILASKEAIAAEIFAKSGLLFSVIHLPKPKFIDLVLLSWLLYSCEK